MTRIALVGVGFMGKTHLGIYDSLDDAEVTALCDIRQNQMDLEGAAPAGNLEVAASQSTLPDAKRYTDFDAMLSAGGFDAVDICLPTFLHAEHSIRALDAGYHVFCEKPMALDTRETDSVLEAIRRTGKLFQVGQCLRFWPAYVELKRIVDSGEYGEVRAASFTRLSNRPTWTWDQWIHDTAKSGNAALDLHIHDVDMIRWLFGEPKAVRATGVRVTGVPAAGVPATGVPADSGGFAHITADYRFESGIAVSATGGWICSDPFGFRMQALLILERAVVELDSTQKHMLTLHPADGASTPVKLDGHDGFYHELASFVGGICSGKLSDRLTPEDAAASVRVCRAEIESATRGIEVEP